MGSHPLSESDWPHPVVAWSTVAAFCVTAVLSYTDRQILSLLVDPIRADLRISDSQVGVLQGVAFALVYSFAGLPLGRLADVVSRRRVILAGVALWSAGTLICGYSGSFWALFFGRMVVGVGEAALAPAATSMIADLFPAKHRGVAIGLFVMGMVMGGGVAILLGGAVLSAASSGSFSGIPLLSGQAPWRASLIILGLLGLPMLLALSLVREPPRREVAAVERGERRLGNVVGQLGSAKRVLVPLVLGCGLMSVGDFATLSWAPTLLSRSYGLRPAEIALILGPSIVAAGVVACLGGGALSDWAARRRGPSGRLILAAISACAALPFSLLVFARTPALVIAAVALWSLFSTVGGVVGLTALQELVPNRVRGLGTSIVAFGNIMLGLGGGATLTGVVADHLMRDPRALDRSLTLVIAPAGAMAILLFLAAARSARSVTACD